MLKHTVSIVRYTQGSVDDYGQPSRTPSTLATVAALVQPKGTRLGGGQVEEVTTTGEGPGITDHVIFLRVTTVNANDEVYADSAGIHTGKTFEVKQVRDGGGQGHHLELDVRLIEPELS